MKGAHDEPIDARGKMMKILHTADWHLGKLVNEYSMLEDQAYLFRELYQLIERERPDVIIISGDIYDRSIPPKSAVELFDEVLNQLSITYQLPVLIISGNHDSQERLDFGKAFFEKGNVYIEGTFNARIRQVVLEDDYGPIHFHLIPYVTPAYARHLFGDDTIETHQDVMEKILETIHLDGGRHVLVNHNFFAGSLDEMETSDSERLLSIGGTEVIDVELVKDFDYVALGHLHRPQKVKYDHVRYSGSILKYSVSEIDTVKGVYLVDLKEKGNVSVTFCPLRPLRDFIRIEGKLEELLQPDVYLSVDRDAYIHAVLTDEKDLYDPLGQLRTVYPYILQIDRPHFLLEAVHSTRRKAVKTKTPFELYQDFFLEMTGQELEPSELTIIREVMSEIHEEGDEA